MFVVGLTGGIGSGKSAASARFAQLGITIVDADIAARTVVALGSPALAQIAQHFGPTILQSDGNLDRAALRAKIFSNDVEKRWLENLLHPLIAAEILQGLAQAASPYVVFVSPLLIESNQTTLCDQLLVIDVPEHLQIERTVNRDHNDIGQLQKIISSQASRQQRLEKATQVIENTAGIVELEAQVDKLHPLFLAMAAQKAAAT